MTSILKNQLLKHLSRYTKNLSSDKINISTFRGEGELSNLQLDENVLTELLELPSWLRLTSAWCNHVSFRIHWTKLKSTPITLSLDEVKITVETCNLGDRRDPSPSTQGSMAGGLQSLTGPQGKYSFINKVIDGITILVNNVNVNFVSPAFTANIQMSRIRVESKTPKWLLGDLRVTRLKDPSKGIILIFKEMSWQTVRIEASSTQDPNLTPLRLLTNQARCRITIKKKLSDCSVVSSRLVLILDDLLWVLTDSQLKAALHFVDSLTDLIKSSTKTTQRKKAQRKLETLPEYHAFLSQQSRSNEATGTQMTAAQKSFALFDVKETSYHFYSQRIDLHLCDDAGDGRSCHPTLKDGGALQISVQGFQVDFYPYHLAKANRLHWPKYKEANVPPALWLEQSLNSFKESLLSLSDPNRKSTHAPLERTPNIQQQSPTSTSFDEPTINMTMPTNQNPSVSGTSTPSGSSQHSISSGTSPAKKHILDNLDKLMTTCIIVRLEDFTLYRVTTTGKKQMPKEFISGDKDRYSFPPDLPALHAEYTYFYYPGDFVFPLPPSKMYVYVNPVQISFDLESCLWFSSFALNLHESLLRTSVVNTMNSPSPPSSGIVEPNLMYMDVKMEAIMPRVVFEASSDAASQRDRPKTMNIQISRFAITNIRETGSSRADLAQALHALQEGTLVFASDFPAKDGDMCVVTDRLLSHVSAADVIQNPTPPLHNSPPPFHTSSISSPLNNLTRYALWIEPRDVWCIKLDPVWIDFYGARSIGPNRSIPFIDAVPVTIWLHGRSDFDGSKKLNEQLVTVDCHTGQQQFTEKYDELKYHLDSQTSVPGDGFILSIANLQSLDNILYNNNKEPDYNVQYSKPIDRNHVNNLNNSNRSVGGGGIRGGNDDEEAYSSSENTKIPSSLNINADDDMSATTADLHVVAHVANLVSIQIDHFQYLFLLRLSEELTELATFLSLDSKRIMNQNHNEKSIVIGCVIPQVEVTLVMPSQTPGKELSGGDGESVIPDSCSLGDDLQTINSNLVWPNNQSSFDLMKNSNAFGSVESPTSPVIEQPLQSIANNTVLPSYTSNPNTHGYNVQIKSEPTISTVPQTSSSNIKAKVKNTDLSLAKEINSTVRSMKKGFSNFMTSLDTTLTKQSATNDDVSDTYSLHSDISSDSENFIMILGDDKTTDCMDVMFKLNPFNTDSNLKASPVEVASEVYEEQHQYKTNMSSPSEPSEASSCRRRDLVSMVTFRLTTVELIRQNKGYESSIRLQVSAISCDECGAIPWDEFQSKFGTRCRAWHITPYNPEAPPVIKVRFEETLKPPENVYNITDRKSFLSWFTHKAEVRVKDINLQLAMSTVVGLGDLAEDEIIPKVLPVVIFLENIRLNLIEDRPPVNITSPGPMPINFEIGKMEIRRDDRGVFCIQPQQKSTGDLHTETSVDYDDITVKREKDRDREILSLQLIMQQLKLDNESLRRQLLTSERTTETTKSKAKQENDTLKCYLKAAQDDISTLLDEKRTLLDTVRSLQMQLTSNKNDSNR